MENVDFTDCQTALKNVRNYLSPTPVTKSLKYSQLLGYPVYLKWENKHYTGSFKERGVVHFLCTHLDEAKKKGICAASAGNHALALSYHASRLGIECHLVMPRFAPLVKVQQSKQFGAKVTQFGDSVIDSMQSAQELCKKNGYVLVPPFDHSTIIAGQSTFAAEALEQVPDLDSIIVPVGGGGLLSGISIVTKNQKPDVFVVGVQSEWALRANAKSDNQPTIKAASIADGIAVKKIGAITGPILKKNVDLMLSANESEIAQALIQFLDYERAVIEGAAAAAFVALNRADFPKNLHSTLVVVSGSNIDMNVLSRLIERDMGIKNRLLRLVLSVPDVPGLLHMTTGILANSGANVLQVHHDRSFSLVPGNVDITFVLEVRDKDHKDEITAAFRSQGFSLTILDDLLA